MLITQSSWLLTLSPNCQIAIPNSLKHLALLPSGKRDFYATTILPAIASPLFRGAQRYEVFRIVKPPPSILRPTCRQGAQRYEVFDIRKPPLRGHRTISQRPGQPCSWLYPTVILPVITSPFLRERKGTKFFALSRLSPGRGQRDDLLGFVKRSGFCSLVFLTLKEPLLFPGGGKGTKFLGLSRGIEPHPLALPVYREGSYPTRKPTIVTSSICRCSPRHASNRAASLSLCPPTGLPRRLKSQSHMPFAKSLHLFGPPIWSTIPSVKPYSIFTLPSPRSFPLHILAGSTRVGTF